MKLSLLYRWGCHLVGLLLMCSANVACSETTIPSWDIYKERFITAEGRVVDTGNNDVSHSEGQGWGMILALAADDRETFESLWSWTQRSLTRRDLRLFSWRYDPAQTPPVSDPNNATDGDLFIAWALALAAERWDDPNYRNASAAIRAEIAKHLVREVAGYRVLLPGLEGFSAQNYVDLNLSYWFMPALQHFAQLEPGGPWQSLINDGRRLLEAGRFGVDRLPVDWMRLNDDGTVTPSPRFPPRFGFDAVRIPLYFSWVGFRGDGGLAGIAAFWQAGTQSPAWIDVTNGERAPFPVSQGVAGVQALLSGRTPTVSTTALRQEDYYSSSLLLLSHLAASKALVQGSSVGN